MLCHQLRAKRDENIYLQVYCNRMVISRDFNTFDMFLETNSSMRENAGFKLEVWMTFKIPWFLFGFLQRFRMKQKRPLMAAAIP
mmetsp:Transcript_10818/g.18514  ORF Transcript_10818/g.18514 Transcript_10818/m.18514 type:complete len:84 (+) Transcript_10818:674-925(+)